MCNLMSSFKIYEKQNVKIFPTVSPCEYDVCQIIQSPNEIIELIKENLPMPITDYNNIDTVICIGYIPKGANLYYDKKNEFIVGDICLYNNDYDKLEWKNAEFKIYKDNTIGQIVNIEYDISKTKCIEV